MEELRSLADLLDLQEVDLQIDRLLHDRQSLPELDQYRKAHEHAETLTSELTDAEGALRQTSLELDKTEGELEINVARLDAEQNRLYAGGMSARDADYLRREVEMLDRKRGEAEDLVLELMDVLDGKHRHEVIDLHKAFEWSAANSLCRGVGLGERWVSRFEFFELPHESVILGIGDLWFSFLVVELIVVLEFCAEFRNPFFWIRRIRWLGGCW